ncbi:MAG: ATP-binding protein [Acidobacteriota bacterium]
MEFPGNIELFSHTFDNRFILNLFDLLLCGVILLVIVRGWRAHTVASNTKGGLFLIAAFLFLGASFALGAVFAGAFFFFRRLYSEGSFDLMIHTLQASAWLMLTASAYARPAMGHSSSAPFKRSLVVFLTLLWLSALTLLLIDAGSAASFHAIANPAAAFLNLLLLVFAFICFRRRPLGSHNFAAGALLILILAALLRLASFADMTERAATIIWNLEQFAWSLALLTLALAVGETSRDLFDRVFVGLQVAFILLASVMILVITQTEKIDYLTAIRARSDELAERVRARVDYLGQDERTLTAIIEREDFLQRAMLGLGHIPELKVVRIASASEMAVMEIGDDGRIAQSIRPFANQPSQMKRDEYFLIESLPLTRGGAVEFYGTREVLDRHIRKRIIIIFALFTGVVALSTVMIGLVVRGASRTIHHQKREIEEAHQKLMQSSKLAAIGQLAAGVAHEINNPATTILSRASFLLSDDVSLSEREDLEAIVTQAQRIARITGNLLSFSRPQVRRIAPTEIDRVIENSLLAAQDSLEASHIAVEKDLPPRLPRVLADEESLARALENLYRNAIDAMADGGWLRIRASKADAADRLRLEISDTGEGIDRENLSRIFDPFFTTKEAGKGTGLGLSIVHGIIAEHDGTITVESEKGRGTTFVMLLPTEG